MRKIDRVIIGCDPAYRKNGFSLCFIDIDRTVRFITFKEPLDFIGWLLHERPSDAIVYIENSKAQKGVFSKYFKGKSLQVAASAGERVGMNKCYSDVAYKLFKEVYKDKYVFSVTPSQKGAKWINDSIPKAACLSLKLNLLKSKMNQDERDSLKLALRYF